MDEEEPDISADGDKVELNDDNKSFSTHCKFQRFRYFHSHINKVLTDLCLIFTQSDVLLYNGEEAFLKYFNFCFRSSGVKLCSIPSN